MDTDNDLSDASENLNFNHLNWSKSPEDFLDFLLYIQPNINNGRTSIEEIGITIMETIQINLSPFKNIEDLLKNGTPSGLFHKNPNITKTDNKG
jgi:hypothetical protein